MTDEPRRIAILVQLPERITPNDPTGEQRLRRFLKAILRSYGIRCLAIRPPAETVTFGDRDAQTQHKATPENPTR